MNLHMLQCLLGCGVCVAAAAAGPNIPELNWTERSDWVNVKTDITPAAVGDGVKDDTAAIQKAFDGVATGVVMALVLLKDSFRKSWHRLTGMSARA